MFPTCITQESNTSRQKLVVERPTANDRRKDGENGRVKKANQKPTNQNGQAVRREFSTRPKASVLRPAGGQQRESTSRKNNHGDRRSARTACPAAPLTSPQPCHKQHPLSSPTSGAVGKAARPEEVTKQQGGGPTQLSPTRCTSHRGTPIGKILFPRHFCFRERR